jgi:hypothetical protein
MGKPILINEPFENNLPQMGVEENKPKNSKFSKPTTKIDISKKIILKKKKKKPKEGTDFILKAKKDIAGDTPNENSLYESANESKISDDNIKSVVPPQKIIKDNLNLSTSFDINNTQIFRDKPQLIKRVEDQERDNISTRRRDPKILADTIKKGFEKQEGSQMLSSLLFSDLRTLPATKEFEPIGRKKK